MTTTTVYAELVRDDSGALRVASKTVEKEDGQTEEREVYTAVANTDDVDRYNEVVLPRGATLDNFVKNPVMLDIHDHRKLPVGRVLDIRVSDSEMEFDFEFSPEEEGQKFKRLYDKKFMNAFSIGFFPTKYTWIDEEAAGDVVLALPDGSTQTINLDKYGDKKPDLIINGWDLLEISPVPVPANPNALRKALITLDINDIHGRSIARGQNPGVTSILRGQVENSVAYYEDILKAAGDLIDNGASFDPVVSASARALDTSPTWDLLEAEASVTRYACQSAEGKDLPLEEIDWFLYAKAHLWVDEDNADKPSGYRYLHHTARKVAGQFKLFVSEDGAQSAMVALLRDYAAALDGEGGYSDDEFQAMYHHLAVHYADLELPLPDLCRYDDQQLANIERGLAPDYTEDACDETAGEQNGVPEDALAVAEIPSGVQLATVDDLKELETSMRVRLGVIHHKLTELLELSSTPSSAQAPAEPVLAQVEEDDPIVDLKEILNIS